VDYVHRIGRTGRAQAVGDAFTLVTPENAGDIRDIQRFIGAKIPELRLEGFDYKPFGEPRPPQPRGQRHPRGRHGHGGHSQGGGGQGQRDGQSGGGHGQGQGQNRWSRFGGRRNAR
jgi:ATP-dependent RNA helicase RhlE